MSAIAASIKENNDRNERSGNQIESQTNKGTSPVFAEPPFPPTGIKQLIIKAADKMESSRCCKLDVGCCCLLWLNVFAECNRQRYYDIYWKTVKALQTQPSLQEQSRMSDPAAVANAVFSHEQVVSARQSINTADYLVYAATAVPVGSMLIGYGLHCCRKRIKAGVAQGLADCDHLNTRIDTRIENRKANAAQIASAAKSKIE